MAAASNTNTTPCSYSQPTLPFQSSENIKFGFSLFHSFHFPRTLKESDNGNSRREPSVLINLEALHPQTIFISFKSDSVTQSATNSASRFVCSSAQQPQLNHEEKANEEKREAMKQNLEPDNKEEDEDADHLNKKTGEVGGPKGPEPTRYGDW